MVTDRPVTIRPALAPDAAAVAAIYKPYVTDSVTSFEAVPPSAGEMARRMSAQPRLPWLLALRSDVAVGYCYAATFRSRPAYRWSVECSVYLSPDERGRGTGRALYGTLLPLLASLGHVNAYAGISLPNPASVRFHEALGFEPVGVFKRVGFKHGAWRDVGWWQRSLGDVPHVPVEPRTWNPES